jgi:hypothetical protein
MVAFWFRTKPVARLSDVASVKDVCQVTLCIGRALNGTPHQSRSLSALCRTRYITPSRLWPSNTVAVARAAAALLSCNITVSKLKHYGKNWDVVFDTTFETICYAVSHDF